jgi:hypothetical protein
MIINRRRDGIVCERWCNNRSSRAITFDNGFDEVDVDVDVDVGVGVGGVDDRAIICEPTSAINRRANSNECDLATVIAIGAFTAEGGSADVLESNLSFVAAEEEDDDAGTNSAAVARSKLFLGFFFSVDKDTEVVDAIDSDDDNDSDGSMGNLAASMSVIMIS